MALSSSSWFLSMESISDERQWQHLFGNPNHVGMQEANTHSKKTVLGKICGPITVAIWRQSNKLQTQN